MKGFKLGAFITFWGGNIPSPSSGLVVDFRKPRPNLGILGTGP